MRNYLLICMLIGSMYGCKEKGQSDENVQGPGKVTYPVTRTVDVEEDHFGTLVKDGYRWLENDVNEDSTVRNWVTAQNDVTFDYLSKIPYREQLEQRLNELANYPKQTTPYRAGKYYFYSKNDGLQNQYVIYYKEGLNGEEKVFLDPNQLSADGTVTQSLTGFSRDRKYVAINQNKAGSDWNEIYIKDIPANKMLSDKIEWSKFSGAAWHGEGFYYSAYDAPKGKEFTGSSENQKVYYHKLGTKQSEDKLIYSDPKHPKYYLSAQTTEDERYLFIYVNPGTSGTEILWKDLRSGSGFTTLFKGFDYEYGVLDNDEDQIIVMTNHNAPNYKVVKVDPKNPAPENWKEIIPEQKEFLSNVSVAGGKLFAFYLKDVRPVIVQYTRSGEAERQIALPNNGIGGTVSGFAGERDDDFVFFSFTTFLSPADIYKYDIRKGAIELYKKAEIKFDPSQYVMSQVFYPGKDGTKIPMFVVHKKGIKMDGSHPCLLYGYGGFQINITPTFSSSRLALLEQGFIYAVANIRGGNEYGEEWHKAGMLEKKQTVFDDFIAASEYLVKEKYTSTDKLAIAGRSNGGLLVGACMTQRPDLYAVALPGVGVLDMLRYHKFTVGWGWAVEYGNADSSKEEFEYLYKYSPLHNLKPGTDYPATFITTADHDDRVVPAHSFKYAAALQTAHAGDDPVLIRIDTQAGHGAGKPLAKILEEDADWMSFTMWNVGIKHLTISDKP